MLKDSSDNGSKELDSKSIWLRTEVMEEFQSLEKAGIESLNRIDDLIIEEGG